jgi:UDP-N-acetylglucosamine/UDP-N-acetylgalactosamine diphosphorylase
MPDVAATKRRLDAINQSHLLRFYDELPADRQPALLDQIDALDLESVPALVDRYVKSYKPSDPLHDLDPAPYYPQDPTSPIRPWNREGVRAAGARLLAKGKIAAFTVAGGQGSRLGFDAPKGCFPAGAVTGKPLFQFFAEALLKAESKYGAPVPWYVMTSPLNHEPTITFFRDRNYFGLDERNVIFFPQGVLPTFDKRTGRILLADRDVVATNPDGHGGSLTALARSGALDDMQAREIEHISYFHVDNPIPHILDPVFIGLHTTAPDTSAEMSSKMIAKQSPDEKVGIFCVTDRCHDPPSAARRGESTPMNNPRLRMIEYSDLPPDLARATGDDGRLLFLAGNPGIHVISVEFVRRLTSDDAWALPFHRAEKVVPCIDPATGQPVQPAEPNAVKLEKFVFDALTMCRSSIILETDREEFAPIKNAEGADSPASSARIQTARAARWLELAGVTIPRTPDGEPDCTIELSPLTAVEPEDLHSIDLPTINPGDRIAI